MVDLKKQWICIKFYVNLRHTASETHEMLVTAFSGNVMGIQMSEWFTENTLKRWGLRRIMSWGYRCLSGLLKTHWNVEVCEESCHGDTDVWVVYWKHTETLRSAKNHVMGIQMSEWFTENTLKRWGLRRIMSYLHRWYRWKCGEFVRSCTWRSVKY